MRIRFRCARYGCPLRRMVFAAWVHRSDRRPKRRSQPTQVHKPSLASPVAPEVPSLLQLLSSLPRSVTDCDAEVTQFDV